MTETRPGPEPTPHGRDGARRLRAVVGRSVPPQRPVGDDLLSRWYLSAGSALPFDEWADPATRHLAEAFVPGADLVAVEEAVVAFAQARAGAEHPAEALVGDLVALVRLAWPSSGNEWSDWIDPVGLMARALGAWAADRDSRTSGGDCIDPATGLASASFLRLRVRELHDQCRALDISAPNAFGALVVELELSAVAAPERVGIRVETGGILASRFRAGETVAALGSSRLVAVMPAYGIGRAIDEVTADFAGRTPSGGVGVTVQRRYFADDPDATFQSLAGTSVGS
jgi:hypothetical protein